MESAKRSGSVKPQDLACLVLSSAYQTNGPNDSSRTLGHGHGHVYGHARAIPI
jgi:hypothetical protein